MNDPLPDDLSFEKALGELDRIVQDLEDGRLGLEDSLSRYEQGVSLLKRCHSQLRQAEQRILLLTGVDADEQPVLQPFQHAASAETPRAAVKRAPRRPADGANEIPF